MPGRQNHALDCRVYARAAAFLAGLDRFTDSDWTARENLLAPPVAAVKAAAGRRRRRPKRRGWIAPRKTGWLKKGDR
jgi:phage terminase large subunit GpA-like protein